MYLIKSLFLILFLGILQVLTAPSKWKAVVTKKSTQNINGSIECLVFNLKNPKRFTARHYEFKITLRNINSFIGVDDNEAEWKLLGLSSSSRKTYLIIKNTFLDDFDSTTVKACYSATRSVSFKVTAHLFSNPYSTYISSLSKTSSTSTISSTSTRPVLTSTKISTTTTVGMKGTKTRTPSSTTSSFNIKTTTIKPSSSWKTSTKTMNGDITSTVSLVTPTSTTFSILPTQTGGGNNNGIEQKLANGKLLVGYWGQMSTSGEQSLSNYCSTDDYDVINVSFLDQFRPTSTVPVSMNLAGHCWNFFQSVPYLLNCPDLTSQINYCQSKGKKVLLSIGGAIADVGFKNTNEANLIAQSVWDLFLGGSSQYRPFGSAVLDGIDLDIESGSPSYYDSFLNRLKQLYNQDASKKYYISGAPQCFLPDILQNTAWKYGWVDWMNIQFYNNWCGLQNFNNTNAWNYKDWVSWRDTTSVNPNTKLIIGSPGSSQAAGSGYVSISQLENIITKTKQAYPNYFGGVSLWDVGASGSQTPSYSSRIRTILNGL